MRYTLLNLLILTWVIYGCQDKSTLPPNILWITNEDTGPAWGCYGDEYARTPNIDLLANSSGGFVFTQAFSNAPICAPARSTLITGIYATSLGTQHLRSDIPVPANLKILPELLREAGYYTTNNSKTDYNFSAEGRWDDNSNQAHWQNKPEGSPFFSVFNFGITHEGHTNRLDAKDTESLAVKHDPSKAILPPYYPNNADFRAIWAHMNDLMSVFDQEVGKLVQQLKDAGEFENTIIFVFSDHGYGLPRYKRWLYNSGLQVPFVLHVPPKYQHLVSNLTDTQVDQMVGFVDFAPTVLQLADLPVPDEMEGFPFLGDHHHTNTHIYGYRSRADDCYDVSRSVYDGQYLYVRNYMPHRPYIQNAVIFNRGKASFEALFAAQRDGTLPKAGLAMFERKPVEELYDLSQDPFELNNLLEGDKHDAIRDTLVSRLKAWIIKHHDTGFLNEGEMMVRAMEHGSVYEMAGNSQDYPIEMILEAAERVGKADQIAEVSRSLQNPEPAVRYWSLVTLDAYPEDITPFKEKLVAMLNDGSYSNVILAAELLIKHFDYSYALEVLGNMLRLDIEPVVLQAAISARLIGEKALPLVPIIQKQVMPRYEGKVWGRYQNWLYPMFIGMALDQTMINCGYDVDISN